MPPILMNDEDELAEFLDDVGSEHNSYDAADKTDKEIQTLPTGVSKGTCERSHQFKCDSEASIESCRQSTG